jgi:preprotein translocase subunit SecG
MVEVYLVVAIFLLVSLVGVLLIHIKNQETLLDITGKGWTDALKTRWKLEAELKKWKNNE